MIDYHVHTSFSMDCDADINAMCDAAIKKGIKYLAITDHIDFYHIPELTGWDIDDENYVKAVMQAQERYKELDIVLGVEAGYASSANDLVVERVKKINPDFVIGSVHNIDGLNIYFKEYYEGRTKRQAFYKYLQAIYDSVRPLSEYAHTIGHIGYISKAIEIPYEDVKLYYSEYKDMIDMILKRIVEFSMGMEVNTSGLRYRSQQMLPDFDIVKRYKQLGGEILTFGSDAHIPSHVGENIDKAFDLAKAAGFEYATVYKDKKPVFIKI